MSPTPSLLESQSHHTKLADAVAALPDSRRDTNERKNLVTSAFTEGLTRYFFDDRVKRGGAGWQQWDTSQDASYFGVWVHRDLRQVLTFAEGDITVVECPDDEHFKAEIEVSTALWKAVEDAQRSAFRNHHSTGMVHQRSGNAEAVKPYAPALLVLHLADEAEFMLVRQRAPAAIAVEVVDRHPQSEGAQPREGWPQRCTRIGSRPDVPAWVGPETAVETHQRSWAELARQRIKSLACSALAVEVTLNTEVPRV